MSTATITTITIITIISAVIIITITIINTVIITNFFTKPIVAIKYISFNQFFIILISFLDYYIISKNY